MKELDLHNPIATEARLYFKEHPGYSKSFGIGQGSKEPVLC